ncbi:MAG: phosphohydrolase [Clostridia bacterium]|nr:phosphohydrolase [Clostridia bacterium]
MTALPAADAPPRASVMNPVSGRKIDLLTFSAADVCLKDIAHALSLQCRAGGHFLRFYSVAQHSLNCEAEAAARRLPPRTRLAALLHDAGEAYLSDLIRPVKVLLPDYQALERRIDAAVLAAFGLDDLEDGERDAVRAIDDAMLHHEFSVLRHDVEIPVRDATLKSRPDTDTRDPAAVRGQFEARCRSLCGELGIVFAEG